MSLRNIWYTWRDEEPRCARCEPTNVIFGTLDTIRTCDLLVRSQTLYPAELRVLVWHTRYDEGSSRAVSKT